MKLTNRKTKTTPAPQRPELTLEQKLDRALGAKIAGESQLRSAVSALDVAVVALDQVRDAAAEEIYSLTMLSDEASMHAVSAQVKADGARQIG